MSTLQAIFLGIVQGLTEFLPISSSAHLRIVPTLFGWDDAGSSFTAVIQLGTMAAVVLYFWRDLWRITTAWFGSLRHSERRSDLDVRMGWYLIVATIPIGILGVAFKDQIETGARDLRLVAAALVVGGLVLLYAEKVGARRKTLADADTGDSVVVGLAQALALVPGVSRSGATIGAGLFLGYTRGDAARFSFLLSIPAVVLSGLFSLKNVGANNGPGVSATIVATVVSFLVGYAAIAWFLKFLVSHSFRAFVVYRVALGLLLIVLLLSNTIDAR